MEDEWDWSPGVAHYIVLIQRPASIYEFIATYGQGEDGSKELRAANLKVQEDPDLGGGPLGGRAMDAFFSTYTPKTTISGLLSSRTIV